ncbi:MAG: tRNA uridine(34) 5-carboxymethylaminomethyl modification radical SAM/GNAT enzyme Elp3 [Eggerthellaceae bacterium]|nr:tRNA uridine(34) 5-carboxymethylaminomethyl modification radical SAM/GNAT enzyme Elp3 [Eggerthellaceae bacterium]
MDELIKDIFEEIKNKGTLDEHTLAVLLAAYNAQSKQANRTYVKKKLIPHYLKIKRDNPILLSTWSIGEQEEKAFFDALRMKPRRTASGVATITVITKPWPCSGECIYCPNDIRMPKSYLSDEPACQRAERNCFDPYLQTISRLRALTQMGHPTDKVELIVLGGNWSDYPVSYQIWFVNELFCALNDWQNPDTANAKAKERRAKYKKANIASDTDVLISQSKDIQQQIDDGKITYNRAFESLYANNPRWKQAGEWQKISDDVKTSLKVLESNQRQNEFAENRMVGLVVETRPDTVDSETLSLCRTLGCTKIQMGIQSLNKDILALNNRNADIDAVVKAFELCRLFGFKLHTHFMVNLAGATVQSDIEDYRKFVSDERYLPDEIKLYPCVLVKGTKLYELWQDKRWVAYSEDELVDVLSKAVLATPPYTRISRMIRDISAHDIVAGNKKTNLRQIVEENISDKAIEEIRMREISTQGVDIDTLKLDIYPYETTATKEYFLQWVTPSNKIAGFLRLSVPDKDYLDACKYPIPQSKTDAMIREVHVYGNAAQLGKTGDGAQHYGLGKKLIEKACEIAKEAGRTKLHVISSVGTRPYYRQLGFEDNELYQTKIL